MPTRSPYLALFEDVQAELRNLMVEVRTMWRTPDLLASEAEQLRTIEDRLYVIGVGMDLVRGDLVAADRQTTALQARLDADIATAGSILAEAERRYAGHATAIIDIPPGSNVVALRPTVDRRPM